MNDFIPIYMNVITQYVSSGSWFFSFNIVLDNYPRTKDRFNPLLLTVYIVPLLEYITFYSSITPLIFMLFSIKIYIFLMHTCEFLQDVYPLSETAESFCLLRNASLPQSHRQHPVLLSKNFRAWLLQVQILRNSVSLYVVRLYVILFSPIWRVKYSNFYRVGCHFPTDSWCHV